MKSSAKLPSRRGAASSNRGETRYDVIVVGGGPAGSTLAWKLASAGVQTIVLDSAKFPREKVCGDYVEPRGLRILDRMGGLGTLEAGFPLPITHSSTHIDAKRHYIGRIPFYGVHADLPPHGYIVPRDSFDSILLDLARKAGAEVHEQTYVTGFEVTRSGVNVQSQSGGKRCIYRGRVVVGADGVNSVVARCAGLSSNDARHIALSQRAYADGFDGRVGEAAFFFDRDFFPGYGWMFPMIGGRVNFGVGILKETCQREGVAVPSLFRRFFAKLKNSHPRCRKLVLSKPPMGGIVKTYGAAGPNHFDRGLLIGDAGSFVDPMTGEGITPAMESALIAARIVSCALDSGCLDAEAFSAFETEYRRYFDPAMIFLDLCAATLRNPHYWESWKRALVRGCAVAEQNRRFAATAGACFGGLEVNPPAILAEVWKGTAQALMTAGSLGSVLSAFAEGAGWLTESLGSFWRDPGWHAGWMMDVNAKWLHALATMSQGQKDPRIKGVY